jgi:signal transduction histidine kinase
MNELLNLIGLSTGVALYAMLLVMAVRSSRSKGEQASDAVLLATALLGLAWNLAALPIYELPKVGVVGPFPWLVAIGFGALGLLPAVVVHSVLRERPHGIRGTLKRTIAAVAYGASGLALILQVRSALAGSAAPSVPAMQLLTSTFVALIIPLAVATRGQPGARRALWIAALAAFAVSAMHLSQAHQRETSWPVELLGHHASVPLAFAMLYQDYPFALADLFLKRALTLLLLVATSFAAIAAFGSVSPGFGAFVQLDPRRVGALVSLWVATALVYPALKHAVSWFVDTIVLHRADYHSLRACVTRLVEGTESIPAILTGVSDLLAPALNARSVSWHELTAGGEAAEGGEAYVNIPTADEPHFVIIVAELMGGRRLFSDDLATLDMIGLIVARRIDAVRMTNERHERELREQQMQTLASEAELRALRAQINPHFLFNALTTIGYLIQTTPSRALDTLMRLTSLLRAVLRSDGEATTLGRELDIIEAYLDIERARFEDRLRVIINVPGALRSLRMPALLLQPLVENALKHGIAPLKRGGDVVISAHLEASGPQPRLTLTVHDSGAGATPIEMEHRRRTGVGLRNVERRLECQFGNDASMTVQTAPGEGTTVSVSLPAEAVALTDIRRAV